MEPGRYSVAIRAVGYELPGAKTAQVEVTAQATAALDINLVKTRNLAAQLSNGEWLQSFTGTEQRKEGLYRCVSCHTLERIAKSTYNAAEMAQVVQRMTTWAQGSQPIRPQPQLGRSIGTPNAAQIAFGQYLSTINLSSSGEWPYTLKTDPRPKGKATRVIITEYDLPRREAMPHDAQMDMRGMVWYGDFGSQYVGSLDPKTGKTTEYVVPITKPGAPTGNLDIRFDRDGMIWIGSMMQGSLVKFDPKYQKFESWGAPDFLKRNDARIAMVMPEQTHVDGKVWIGADNEYQVDMATGEWTEIAEEYCLITGAPVYLMLSKLEALGLTTTDIHNLEYLEDRKVLNNLQGGFRRLKRNVREDVIDYFVAFANMLESELIRNIRIDYKELIGNKGLTVEVV